MNESEKIVPSVSHQVNIHSTRFWSMVAISDADKCWTWKGLKDGDGYGRFAIKKKNLRSHRFAWEISYGPIPEGMWVLHHCDNPSCVNPSHLFVGTALDNTADKCAKGRQPKGVNSVNSKITEDDVRAIRALRGVGRTYISIAKEFSISKSNVEVITKGMSWRHI